MGKAILLSGALLFFLSGLTGQPLRFDQLNVEDGLSQNTVNCILKDSRGYLWIGTNDGLNRYDGYQFTVFRNDKNDEYSLSDNKVYTLLESQDGRLWVGTRDGLNVYDRTTGQFRRRLHRPADGKRLKSGFIRAIYEDSEGRLWVGAMEGGLYLKQKGSEAFVSAALPGVQAPVDVSSLLEDSRGDLWIATSANGLFRLRPGSREPEAFTVVDALQKSNYAKKLYEDRQGRLWVGTQGDGAYLLGQDRGLLHHFKPEKGDIVKDIIEDGQGNIWMASDGGGISILTSELRPFFHLGHQVNDPHSLASNAVYTLYKDNEGILWAGTFDGGISIYNRNHKKFYFVGVDHQPGKGLSHHSVLCFLEDHQQNIWVGTDGGGLNRFDPETQRFYYLKQEEGQANSLSSNVIAALYEDSRQWAWIGTYTGGLQRYEPGKGITATYISDPADPGSIRNDNVWAILEDQTRRLCIGTLGGLDILDPQTGRFQHVDTENGAGGIYLERVTELYEGRDGKVWVGGKGVRIYDPHRQKLSQLEGSAGRVLQAFDTRAFYEGEDRVLWIGTEGGGLFALGLDKRQVRNFTVADGLPSNSVHTIFEDDAGYLWMSTNEGISRFSPRHLLQAERGKTTGIFRNYCKKDGLQSNQFSYNAGMKSSDGKLYFGGIKGYNYFDPREIKDNPYAPAIEITGLKILDQYVQAGEEGSPLTRPISELDKLTLTYNQSQLFSLEFTALNFTSSDKNQYAYKLEGFLDEWSHIGPRRTATFTNLNPGTYTFRVKAANNDGVWNNTGAALKLTILPPYWKTPWAYALYIFLLLLMLIAFRYTLLTRERMRNGLKIKDLEKQKAEEVNRLKLAFFTNISHEFRTPLALISAPVEQLLASSSVSGEVRQQLRLVQRNTRRLLKLINQLLEFRKVEDNKVELAAERRELVGFVRRVKEAFDGLAEGERIRYHFKSEFEELMADYDPDKLEKILFNLLSNAFKFTKDEVAVYLKEAEENGEKRFCIIVEDNGAGIPPERQAQVFDRFYQAGSANRKHKDFMATGTGIGLAYVKALVELHRGSIRLESEVSKGARFIIGLPLAQPGSRKVPAILGSGSVRVLSLEEEGFTLTSGDTAEEKQAGEADKPILLIVEDNAELREFLGHSFQPSFQILQASDGEEGMQQAIEHLPDIIISDVMMPRKDGIAMCQALKTDDRTSHIPILLLTANTNEERWLEGLETGADDYVTKPFNFRFLKVRVLNLIHSRRLLKRHFSRTILQPSEAEVESGDKAFIKKAIGIIEASMADSNFGVREFAKALGMSRSVLYRKFSALTDQSVKEFINMIRLKRAAQLLASDADYSVSDVAYSVGFSDAQYFSKKFKKFYHATPTEYMEQHPRQQKRTFIS